MYGLINLRQKCHAKQIRSWILGFSNYKSKIRDLFLTCKTYLMLFWFLKFWSCIIIQDIIPQSKGVLLNANVFGNLVMTTYNKKEHIKPKITVFYVHKLLFMTVVHKLLSGSAAQQRASSVLSILNLMVLFSRILEYILVLFSCIII